MRRRVRELRNGPAAAAGAALVGLAALIYVVGQLLTRRRVNAGSVQLAAVGNASIAAVPIGRLGHARVLFTQDTRARCLDGSPAGGYWRAGDHSTVVLWLQGGGYCSTADDCRARARGPSRGYSLGRGGSGGWPELCPPSECAASRGVLSRRRGINPAFYNASRLYLRYCSGDRWIGTAGWSAQVGAHFAGHLIVLAALRWLLRMGLPQPGGRLLIGGRSVGGVGALWHADVAARMYMPHKVAVRALIAWGIDVPLGEGDAAPPWAGSVNLTVPWGASGGPRDQTPSAQSAAVHRLYLPPACSHLRHGEQCDSVRVALGLRAPAFFAQSPHSPLALGGLPLTATTCGYVQEHGAAVVDALRRIVRHGAVHHALWLPRCWAHSVAYVDTLVNRTTFAGALAKWWAADPAPRRIIADAPCGAVQCNPTCLPHRDLAGGRGCETVQA
eukprot:TRINITY_DN56234_c0_g1_i1.p1 TRINITY_DN56234_c0_g1~~TRINITY_DN56234_c0_g1_i1.p1  ORF type:complete len:444 (+),score=25.98 TRINITY_DN56234_c0_g1_i1:80-1411(+)